MHVVEGGVYVHGAAAVPAAFHTYLNQDFLIVTVVTVHDSECGISQRCRFDPIRRTVNVQL